MCQNRHLHIKMDISHVFAEQEFKNCTDLIKRVQFESVMRLDIKGKKWLEGFSGARVVQSLCSKQSQLEHFRKNCMKLGLEYLQRW